MAFDRAWRRSCKTPERRWEYLVRVMSPESFADVFAVEVTGVHLAEIVAALGLGDSIVGLTHSCDYPREAVEGKAIVTSSEISPYSMSQAEIHSIVCGALANGHSLYGLDAQLIEAADPDIILTQALCDVCAVSYPKVLSTCAKVLAGDEARPRVISIEPTTYEEVLNTILHVGEVCGALPQARQLVASLQATHAHTVALVAAKLDAGAPRPRGCATQAAASPPWAAARDPQCTFKVNPCCNLRFFVAA